MSRERLFAAMRESDVVVDQFDVGALGMISWEAFGVGRPVLTYVDPSSEILAYDENSPVFNAHTVDEIVERLREMRDANALRRKTEEARRWARARRMESLLPRYLFYAALATGQAALDFGWKRPHGHPYTHVS
jgi:hypothetical protein